MAVAEREQPGHDCTALVHCVCGHDPQMHDDDEPDHPCFEEGCLCSRWERCTAYAEEAR
jgi:hypothetical protein